jgi:RNA polymerase-binding transcription factor DksA
MPNKPSKKPSKTRKSALPAKASKSTKASKTSRPSKASKPAKSAAPKSAAKPKAAVSSSPKSVEKIREGLIAERLRLRKRLGVIQSDDTTAEASNVGDIADVATNYESREILREIQVTEEDQLRQVEGALKRIEAGTYGQCERCGGKIEPARLEALPHAPTCIACRRREERGEFSPAK